MHDSNFEVGDGDMEEQPHHESYLEEQVKVVDDQLRAEDGQTKDAWEIRVPTKLRHKLVGPWQTSIKLIGRQLSYHAIQTRLACIWHLTSKMTLIDIEYGFFIMRFDLSQDYHHALMDGPWFVGDQYLHVQAWEADFHPYVEKISTTAV